MTTKAISAAEPRDDPPARRIDSEALLLQPSKGVCEKPRIVDRFAMNLYRNIRTLHPRLDKCRRSKGSLDRTCLANSIAKCPADLRKVGKTASYIELRQSRLKASPCIRRKSCTARGVRVSQSKQPCDWAACPYLIAAFGPPRRSRNARIATDGWTGEL